MEFYTRVFLTLSVLSSLISLICILLQEESLFDFGNLERYMQFKNTTTNSKKSIKPLPDNTTVKSINILVWGKFFQNSFASFFPSLINTPLECPSTVPCTLTGNTSMIKNADAVVFHLRDTGCNTMFPSVRYSNQIWIMYSIETAANEATVTGCQLPTFNRTWCYSRNCDETYTYALISPLQTPLSNFSVPIKTGKVLWVSSNCSPKSNRQYYVEELAKYIDINFVTRGCSFSYPGLIRTTCDNCREAVQNYKFYLSFENSFCEDYVSEKAYIPLIYGTVPIVYAGGNHSHFLPKGSYIDANEYSPKDLGEYLNFLDGNEEEYKKYFEWRKYGYASSNEKWHNLCELCRKVQIWQKEPRTLRDRNYILEVQKCRR